MKRMVVLLASLAMIFVTRAGAQDETRRKVDSVFAAYDKAGSPGCALGIVRDGNFVYRKGYGLGSIELNVPLSSASVFYMGSVSKQFTAAVVVLAAEQGFLSLDDDVRKYIPELPDYGHPITIRQMLHHTSGLKDFLSLQALAGWHTEDVHTRQENIELIARQKGLNNAPGDEYLYSNSNYFLLGEVIKRATKKSLEEFAAEAIFKPLGMTQTRYYDDRELVVLNRVAAYSPGKDGKFLVDWSTNFDTVGAGGLMSSVDDLLLWDRNFYANKLGKGTLLEQMQTKGVLNNGKKIGYALGLDIGSYRGLPVVEHGGALFGYRTEILRFPEQRFTVLCLCNLANAGPSRLARKVADIYLEKELKPEAVAAGGAASSSKTDPFPDPSPFAGKYFDPRTHMLFEFTASGGELVAWGQKLQRVSKNQFHDLGTGVITFDDAGGAMKVKLDLDGEPFFAGDRIEAPKLSAAALEAFAGKYRSEELQTTYRIAVEDGKLMIHIGWYPAMELKPLLPDKFDCDFGTVEFRRDVKGAVTGLSVFEGRARDVQFERIDLGHS
jgi:CubicO group peptidase (beta-lactamase class C family)